MTASKLVPMLAADAVGAALTLIGGAMVLSLLIVFVLAIAVVLRREWVPVTYNVRSLAVRKLTTGLTVAGLALVVFIFATALMLANGMKRTLVSTGDPMNVKVLRKGAQNEFQSDVSPEQARQLAIGPEVALGRRGPLASAELLVLVFALREGAHDDTDGTNIAVRGVGPMAADLHVPEELAGRMFEPGKDEIVIGKALVGRMHGSTLGGTMSFARRKWTVVGVADYGGTAFDSEIWGDLDQMSEAFQRRPVSITLQLKDRADMAALAGRVEADPQLNMLQVVREIDYWDSQSREFTSFVTSLGLFVAVIFSFGAVLGAMITMYAQVSARTREIGMLRALGFRQRSVLVSFVLESVLLAAAAGGIGLVAASFMQRGQFTTMNWQTFNAIGFRFKLTPGIALGSMLFAMLMGYCGGLLPALGAARMSIVRATRGG